MTRGIQDQSTPAMGDSESDSEIELRRAYDFSTFFNSSKFSDFTIHVADGRKFHAHKLILSQGSTYFRKLFDGNWKETATNTITLSEDDKPYAVEAMLHYIYGLNYNTKRPEDVLTGIFSAKVYALGEKYGIPSLKTAMTPFFASEVATVWDTDGFPQVVAEVYTSTPHQDRVLRDLVIGVACKHIRVLSKKEGFVQFVSERAVPDFVIDLLRHLGDRVGPTYGWMKRSADRAGLDRRSLLFRSREWQQDSDLLMAKR